MTSPNSTHPTAVVGLDPATGEIFKLGSGGGGAEGGATETTLAYMSATQGSIADTPATTDSGSFSYIALFKRLLGKFSNIGAAIAVAELQATTVTEGTVAVDTTIDQVVAADANRRRLIVTNNHASAKLGLSTSGSATFASCAIQLAAGESWVEALAANKAWYAIFDTGGSATVPYQTVV